MLPRWAIVSSGILALGGMLSWALPLGGLGGGYWAGLFLAAVLAGWFTRARERAGGRGREGSGGNPWVRRGEFLCDSCKDNHPDLCSRPERPNASRCPDYRARG